ncbi:MAG: choice-of-anchor Q domain-containing protein [Pseudomonadota bacterium]
MHADWLQEKKYGLSNMAESSVRPLVAAVGCALTASSLQAATITVTTLQDGFIAGECTLREAIYSATYANGYFNDCPGGDLGEDLIVFDPALDGAISLIAGASYFDYGADDSSLVIGDSAIIDGDDRITIYGTGAGRVFNVKYRSDLGFEPQQVKFSNITIDNGGGEDLGGAIYSKAKQLRLDNVNLFLNDASSGGGAVFHRPVANQGHLEVVDSVISDNRVTTAGAGGGIYARSNQGAIVIRNNSFLFNQSRGSAGGAIYAKVDYYGTINIDQNYFYYNRASTGGDGGAIAAKGYYVDTEISTNTFYRNAAGDTGGAVFLTDKLDFNGQRSRIQLTDNEFERNTAASSGGGAYVRLADGDFYGGIANRKTILLSNNRFDDNQSAVFGGALYIGAGRFTDLSIVESNELRNNQSQFGGGAAFIELGEADAMIRDLESIGNAALQGMGGGLLLVGEASSISIGGLSASFDQAALGGGGVALDISNSQVTITDSDLTNNSARCGGGAAIYGKQYAEADVSHSIFTENTVDACGGAISLLSDDPWSPSLTIRYSELSNNDFLGGPANDYRGGGAVFARLSSPGLLQVMNSTLSGNYSFEDGGALQLEGAVTALIAYATFASNSATLGGGGIIANAASCTIFNTLFSDNSSLIGSNSQALGGSQPCEVSWSLISNASNSVFTNQGNNILDQAAQIGDLQDNGGANGRTHALDPGSPAIDAGTAGMGPLYDQRGTGFPRMQGLGPDLGAYEFRPDRVFGDRFIQQP